ncbi:hypothetical protein LEP1GSC104_3486 [Leptospira interrogans str. UI 12621]|uniref:Uncharacterized protein n=1 Tax=Leptospira interrogans str. UI 12621 TaxID=1049937 RepID=A0A0F6HAU0_LEPIR|nr:hypothetical protein LEP1GSC104_3486 [Leptospira interrogans str. UI 12621]EMN78493.1 hypothetical protein LEP1GSC106_2994 [Leptospira interrogans serovar Grippotyphosa str. UI 12764]
MSWHFSQALEGAFLEESSLDGEPSVLSKSILIASPNLSKDRMTKFSQFSRSGMTFALLTEQFGEELLTWFREDFLAKTFQSQVKESESKGSGQVFGKKCLESFAKFDHVTHSWKIPHFLPSVESIEFSGTWPRWGMMLNGECWERTTPELLTSESGFGFLPTPVATNGSGNRSPGSSKFRPSLIEMARKNTWPSKKSEDGLATAVNGGPLNPMWVEWLMGWPLGWTDLEPLETAKFQWWLKSHGIS